MGTRFRDGHSFIVNKTTDTSGECRECQQGYTKDGNAAYPDHIELCQLHGSAALLLAALRSILTITARGANTNELSAIELIAAAAVVRAGGV